MLLIYSKILTKQIATSIPAIKPFLSRYFPHVLSSTSKDGQTSSTGNLKSLEPRHSRDRSCSKSLLSEALSSGRPSESADDIYVTKSFHVGVEKAEALPLPSFPQKTK